MIRINPNYPKLSSSYLFSEISRRVAAFKAERADATVINMGVGDVTLPLTPTVVQAFRRAVDEMGKAETFRGYPPELGYEFLRSAIAENDFQARGADVDPDEIVISDGAKSDTANIQELFAGDIRIAIPDPVYPVYVDTNVMAGRTGPYRDGRYGGLIYLDCTEDNQFIPEPPKSRVDLIYLCFPNNPTGATIDRGRLTGWVEYARGARALILYDAAYVSFIRDESLPQTIYEIPGARECAIEFRSFSKTAGFTGTRCAFTVVPKTCVAWDAEGREHSLHALWSRRQSTKFNGVSYPVQRAAAAIYTPEGKKETRGLSDYYLGNARVVRRKMDSLGFACVGGDNSPYVWVRTGADSWSFFDRLLRTAAVVITPGSGFGSCGEGYIRMSAFNSRELVEEAMERIGRVAGELRGAD
ncbi:MAG TPA: LL-diaminopimelate aminotransferase [Spirochaetia bacterium]|nr:LL-diaminopimelate aminotransferase [Spirochaetia bacterium]